MVGKRRKFTLAQGAGISILGLAAGTISLALASIKTMLLFRVILLLFAWFTLWFFSHDLAHHITGQLVGIKFRYYYLGKSAIRKLNLPIIPQLMNRIPVLVLKVDRESLKHATARSRRTMYASGAIVSMILPWLIIPESFSLGPTLGLLFLALVIGNDVFTLYFSPKTGDLYRARKAAE